MKCVLLRVGKGRCGWADTATEDYTRRFSRNMPWEEHRLKTEPERGDIDRVRQREGERILGRLQPGDFLVVLDERGKALDTGGFTRMLQRAQNQSTRRLVFAIGGPHGHGPAVRKRADVVLRLSSLVLNHELARVILAEQLYRVSTILWGGGYHHA